jgi:hypothetical protein
MKGDQGLRMPRYSTLGTRVCGRCDHWSADPATPGIGECRALPPHLHIEVNPNALPWEQAVKLQKIYPPMHVGELGCRGLYRRRTAEAIAEDRMRRDLHAHELNQAALAAKSSETNQQTEGEPNGEA